MTSTELEPVKPATLTERMDYARALASAGLLPDVYRDKPANVLYAMEYGAALGVAPMTAIMGIHVIKGKPTLSADLMAALIRRAGHRLRVHVEDGPVAVAELTRHDDPEYTFRTRWDMERAKKAGLLGKADSSWAHHPLAMLKARAVSEVAREACSEVLNGLIYTPEEMGANTDEDGAPIAEGHIVEDDRTIGSRVREKLADEKVAAGLAGVEDAYTRGLRKDHADNMHQLRRVDCPLCQAVPPTSQPAEDQPPLVDAFPNEPKKDTP